MVWLANARKYLTTHSRFFKPCCTVIKQYQNLFSTASNRFEKSKARTVGKILRKLYAIGNRKSFDKLQISWKKLFAFFFVTVVLKT